MTTPPEIWTPTGARRTGIATQAQADELRALPRSVVATPPASQADRPASPSFIMWMGVQVDGISPWGMAPKLRDQQLRDFWPQETLLAGALATVTARNAALSWKVTGHEATAEAAQGLCNNANFGAGWEDFISRLSLDLYTTDSGAFVELVRTHDSPDAPVFGINNLDSLRCYPTGVPEFPVIYEDTNGRMHRMPWYSVVQLLEMPSPVTPTYAGIFYRLQYSAVSRVLRAAKIMSSITTYTDEKINGRFMRALHLISGVDENHVRDAMRIAETNADQQGLTRYMMPAIVGAVDPSAAIGHTVVELASLPDQFNSKEEREGYILALALGLLTDYGEFAPLPGGGLGTASQSETMNQKSRGKGSGLFQKLILRLMNQHGVLPSNVEFEWDEQDLEADAKNEEIKASRAATRAARLTSGEIDLTIMRQEALEDGDLTQQQFDELQAREAAAAQQRTLTPPPAPMTAVEGEQKGAAADVGTGAVPQEGPQQHSGLRSIEAADEGERLTHEEYLDEGEGYAEEYDRVADEHLRRGDAHDTLETAKYKHDGALVAAGLAVVAEDTGRVLMLQRALVDGDPAAGTWEFPGGHIDDDTPIEAAQREWQEETGMALPDGEVVGEWDSVNGVYRGFVYRIPTEFAIATRDGDMTNPDDPDGDQVEAIAWWDAQHLRMNSAIRQELADNLAPMYEALAMGSKAWDTSTITQERLDYEEDVTQRLHAGFGTALTAIRARMLTGEKANPNHEPAGTDRGGEFAHAPGGPATHEQRSLVELHDNIVTHGHTGATYNVVTGSELRVGTGEEGPYVVSTFPERGEAITLDEYRESGLAAQSAYVATNKDLLTGDRGQELHFGIWVDGERVVFDVVRVVSDRGEALELAGAYGQEAFFDAGKGVEIPSGGSGGAERRQKAEGRRLLALVPLADLVDNPDAQRALYEKVVAGLD